MDDCDLEKLSAAPAKLSPKFNRNVLEYESTVASSIEKVKVDCLTSDSGASYQVFGAGGEKSIPLKEGETTEIKIEVSSEDGTTKIYFIRVKRLSASNASLNMLKLSCGRLDPVFNMDCNEYTSEVACNTEDVTVTATPPDKKCELSYQGSDNNVIPLQLGETMISVTVGSVDGSNKKEYTILVTRKQLPWPVMFKDPTMLMKYECPMTLSPMYNPVSIANSDPKVSMSQPCIDMLTRRSKVNPINEVVLDKDWRVCDSELDNQISNCVALSVYAYKGDKEEMSLRNMAKYIRTSELKPNLTVEPTDITNTQWYKAEFETANVKTAPIDHKVEVRNWEKRLQHMASENNADLLMKKADKILKEYRSKLPNKPGQTIRYEENASPADDIQQISICYAACVKAKSKEAKYHLKLAHSLEEQYYLSEIFGLSKDDGGDSTGAAGINTKAKESSKLEECTAICRLRGVPLNAPLALQLKGIDEEYKSLLESGQSGKADHVQGLYAWRSKQALKGEQSALHKVDESSPLSQAYLKCMDALVLDPNNHLCNLHAGRMLLELGRYGEAAVRLQQACGLKPVSVEARFLLGLALCLRDGGLGDRSKEGLGFINEFLEHLMNRRQSEAEKEGTTPFCVGDLLSEDIMRLLNPQILQGLFVFAQNLQKNPPLPGIRSAKEVYHCICLFSSMCVTAMHNKGAMFKQVEWLLLDCQYSLLEIMMKDKVDNKWVAQRCRYLSAMTRTSTIEGGKRLLALQEKVSQRLVTLNPCNSESLYLLGMTQLTKYDDDTGNKSPLDDARESLLASIELEGKPAAGEAPKQISGQQWWKDKIKSETKPAPTVASSKPAAAPTRGRGAPPARGRGRGAPAPPRGRAAPRGAATRGGRGAAKVVDAKCAKGSEPVKVEEKPAAPPVAPPSGKPAPINRSSYHARLGLARAYSRTDETKDRARSRYEEVIGMAAEVHDAYIELAELLVRSDPLAAVDVYCRFPSSGQEDSFDDAYLSGEIVSILMKHERFDDLRLVEHMVKYGRCMGIGVLEKYMGILDAKFKTNMLKQIYAGVHRKEIDDPDLEAFFKFKCWL